MPSARLSFNTHIRTQTYQSCAPSASFARSRPSSIAFAPTALEAANYLNSFGATTCLRLPPPVSSGATKDTHRHSDKFPILHSLRDEIEAPASKEKNGVTEPDERILSLWRTAQAVCFDIDCTLTINDSLDLLAEFMGVGQQVTEVTNKAMNGSMSLSRALTERLDIINCTPSDIDRFLQAYPAESRLSPGAKELIQALQARGVAVYLISGGFRELCLPIARALGVPYSNLFANRMNWQIDDNSGAPTKLVGFDTREPTAHQKGKPQAIAQLRERFPYDTIVMVGDGITDLEAVQESGGADLFIGYGGVIKRQLVLENADWFINDFSTLTKNLLRYQVAMIGSGAWACAAAKLVASNVAGTSHGDKFEQAVRMWVYDELVDGKNLSSIINEKHQNVKYLPGVHLGDNVVACPSLEEAVKEATILIFCAPHQFIGGIVKQLRGKVRKDAIAISLTKGMRVRPEGPQLISELIRKELGLDCSVLMGPNIAKDIAAGELSEATIGYTLLSNGNLLKEIFETDVFYIQLVNDVVGAEMAGTLKNIVALAAGFVEGLGYGENTKAAIMRAGLDEMMRFAQALYPTVLQSTFLESCGIADLIATCYGGRNRLVAKTFVERIKEGRPATFNQLEAELLAGQKLQGALTSNEVMEILNKKGWAEKFPLFVTVYGIVSGLLPPEAIMTYRASAAQVQLTAEGSMSDVGSK